MNFYPLNHYIFFFFYLSPPPPRAHNCLNDYNIGNKKNACRNAWIIFNFYRQAKHLFVGNLLNTIIKRFPDRRYAAGRSGKMRRLALCIYQRSRLFHSAHGTRASWRRPEEGSGAVYQRRSSIFTVSISDWIIALTSDRRAILMNNRDIGPLYTTNRAKR